jgi:hypothetical protein
MKLQKVLKLVNYSLGEGNTYLWNCYPDARIQDMLNHKGDQIGSVIFNTKTQQVYEIGLHYPGYTTVIAFRWISQKFIQAYIDDCNVRNVPSDVAWDDVYWLDTDKTGILEMLGRIYGDTND